jgi:host factor-I protein
MANVSRPGGLRAYFLPLGMPGGLASLPFVASNNQLGEKRPRGEGARGTRTETTAMADRAQNLQDTFLNHVRKAKIPLTIFLVNGVKLQGVVTWFDNFCVLLRRDGHSQLVYKHAISTIMPGHPVQLFEGAEEAPAGEKV